MKKSVVLIVAIFVLWGCQKKTLTGDYSVFANAKPFTTQDTKKPIEVPTVSPNVLDTAMYLNGAWYLYFDFDKADLTESDKKALDWNVSQNPFEISIEGHCDIRGSDEYNMDLGMRRAVVVKEYMVAKGIPIEHIKTVSMGKRNPRFIKCVDENCHAKNRRATITIK
jgi:peptidoglycan-associated lipoprotein